MSKSKKCGSSLTIFTNDERVICRAQKADNMFGALSDIMDLSDRRRGLWRLDVVQILKGHGIDLDELRSEIDGKLEEN
jgi:hypothetical protein